MGGQRQEKNNLDDSAVLESITSQWWSFSSFVPLVTGALWLWLAASSGMPAVLLGAVPPFQAHSLWRHWDEPRIAWYQGAHQRFIRSPEGREVLEETLRAAGMLPKQTSGTTSQR